MRFYKLKLYMTNIKLLLSVFRTVPRWRLTFWRISTKWNSYYLRLVEHYCNKLVTMWKIFRYKYSCFCQFSGNILFISASCRPSKYLRNKKVFSYKKKTFITSSEIEADYVGRKFSSSKRLLYYCTEWYPQCLIFIPRRGRLFHVLAQKIPYKSQWHRTY